MIPTLLARLSRCARPSVAALLMAAFSAFAQAETILMLSDLQMSPSPAGQVTQPGWVDQGVTKTPLTTVLPLTPTASGSSAGIAASLIAPNTFNWESRGGTAEGRAPVTGTTFNDVVSDLWVTRTMSFTMAFSGLTTGATYRVRTWHNDSYNQNAGFAAGGGTVQLSGTGVTVVSSTGGTVTNLRGAQTDSAFGITSMTFIPTVSDPQITYTRVGGSNYLPVNGVEFTAMTAIVPEPTAASILAGAGVTLAVTLCRRGRRQGSPR